MPISPFATSSSTKTNVPKFLCALYTMLQLEDTTVLAWSQDGTYFQVLDVVRLEKEILPKYFNHSKLTSFQRQLNNFGFRKWTKTRADVCTFSHDALVQCHPGHLNALIASIASEVERMKSYQNVELKSERRVKQTVSDARKMKTSSGNKEVFSFDLKVDELLTFVASEMSLASLDIFDTEASGTMN